MSRVASLLVLLVVSSCGSPANEPTGSSATVTLPPPREAAAPGFSEPVTARD